MPVEIEKRKLTRGFRTPRRSCRPVWSAAALAAALVHGFSWLVLLHMSKRFLPEEE